MIECFPKNDNDILHRDSTRLLSVFNKKRMIARALVLVVILICNPHKGGAQVWQKVESNSTQNFVEVQFIEGAGYALASNGQVLHSLDKGVTWVKKKSVKMTSYAMKFVDDKTGYVLGNAGVFKTIDGAENWDVIFSKTDFFTMMHVFGDGHLVVASSWVDDDEVYFTENDFEEMLVDTALHFGSSMTFLNDTEGHINGVFGGILFTKDGGKTWRFGPHHLVGVRNIREAVYIDDETAILANPQRNYTIQNGTDTTSYTWEESIDEEAIRSEFIYVHQLFVASNKQVYAVGYVGSDRKGFIAHTDDLAKTWTLDTLLSDELLSIAEVSELDFVVTGAFGAIYRTAKENSISDRMKVQNISIWPNPVENELHVKSFEEIMSIRLFRVDGSLVKFSSNASSCDMTGVLKGMYILRVETQQGIYSDRIFKL